MPLFHEMDPLLIQEALKDEKDILSSAVEEQESFYKSFHCPRCKCDLQKEFDSRHVFSAGNIIPRALLRCPICKYLIDPHSNIILESGDASKIPIELIPYL